MRGRLLLAGLLLCAPLLVAIAPAVLAMPPASVNLDASNLQQPNPDDIDALIAEIDDLQRQLQTQSGFTSKDAITLGGTALSTFVGAMAAFLGIQTTNKTSQRLARDRQNVDIEMQLWQKDSELLRRVMAAINLVADRLSSAIEIPLRAGDPNYEANIERFNADIARAQGALIEADSLAVRLKRPKIPNAMSEYVAAAERLSAQLNQRPSSPISLLTLHQLRNDLNERRGALLGELEAMEADIDQRLRESIGDAA